MKKMPLIYLVFLAALIYGCDTILVKSTSYRNVYGDPQSEEFYKFIRSNFTMTNEKVLFAHIADLTPNIKNINDFEMQKADPFSTNKSVHGIVVLSLYNLFFTVFDNDKKSYSNLLGLPINDIRKITMEEFGLNNFSIMITPSDSSNNNVIQIINENSSLIDSDGSHTFYNLLESQI